MPVIEFEVNDATLHEIRQLRETFGAKIDAAVIRKALALAMIAGDFADAGHTITVIPTARQRRSRSNFSADWASGRHACL